MIFDQYSRYRACADLIAQAGIVDGNSVLDVGSGPACLFEHFLPQRVVTFVDPLVESDVERRRITGTVFTEVLNKCSFDCVSAVDVLEHVPPEVRQAFLGRVSNLSKQVVILGFPAIDATDATAVDRALEDQYRGLFHLDYRWLEEHHRYGLPVLAETKQFFQDRGWHCQTIGHGHAPWLKELLGFVVCTWDIPELRNLVLDISAKFNEELYASDFKAPFYRQFLVATRDERAVLAPPQARIDADQVFRDLMDEAYRNFFMASMSILANLDGLRSERVAALAERDAALDERDAALDERDAALDERDGLVRTNSWKITRPLRFLRRMAKYGLTPDDCKVLAIKARGCYRQLPLPVAAKRFFSEAYHNRFLKHARFGKGSRFKLPAFRPGPQTGLLPDYIVWGVIDWHFRHQRPQHLAQHIAASGRRVFYISASLVDAVDPGFKIEPLDSTGGLFQVKLYVSAMSSIYVSEPRAESVKQLRRSLGELLHWANTRQAISLVQHPFWWHVASVLPNSRIVYDCMDHHEGFGNNGEYQLQAERTMLTMSSFTIVTSAILDEATLPYAKRRVLVRNAADYRHFSTRPATVYRDPQGRRVIGYYGAIAEWFDLDLVESVARQHPECCVLLIGRDTVNAASKLGKLANVQFTGEVLYEKLPYYLYSFDICLLPFRLTQLTLATNPVKVYEYLSAGKPVVAVNLPEMAQFDGLAYTATDKHTFLDAVKKLLAEPETKDLVSRRKTFAAGQTWQHRAKVLIAEAEADKFDPKVSVIVITYNNLELTKTCLASLDGFNDYTNAEIIVVDNASSDGSPEFLQQWAAQAPRRKVILNADNRGFAAANNQGLAQANGDYLVLLNNDTHVTAGWLRTLIGHLRRDASIGLIGPVTNNIGNEAKIDIIYRDMPEMLEKSAAFTRRHIGQIYPLRTAAFFCVMMSRSIYTQVGPLNEDFGKGFFEDDDYCRRIEQIGKRVVCAEDVFVHHHLSASFDKLKAEDRRTLFEQNKELYEAKWGTWVPHTYRIRSPHTLDSVLPTIFKGHQFIKGFCNICGHQTRFYFEDPALYRESLNCGNCLSTSRYRSIARGILRAIELDCGIQAHSLAGLTAFQSSKRLRVYDTQPPFYYATCAYPVPDLLENSGWIDIELSQYKPNKQLGIRLGSGITNQNLECLTFDDEKFDIVITSDIMEHVRLDDRAHHEIHRVLKPGGAYVFTVPHNRNRTNTLVRVQVIDPADPDKDVHLLEPEYHGDTNNDAGCGVLSYRVYGTELDAYLTGLGFEVAYSKKELVANGIMNTELFYCKKKNA